VRKTIPKALTVIQLALWAILPLFASDETRPKPSEIHVVKTVAVDRLAPSFVQPLKCDPAQNLYLRIFRQDSAKRLPVEKLDSDGIVRAVFRPDQVSGLTLAATSYFAVLSSGEFYQLGWGSEKQADWGAYVLNFAQDGKFKSATRLESPFLNATQLAVFPSGQYLVSGLRSGSEPRSPLPFTGIFSADGKLLKEVKLADDDDMMKRAAAGDDWIVDPASPVLIKPITRGEAAMGDDGNAYLMRRIAPTVIYVISSEGNVLRRMVVEAPDANSLPHAMHLSGNKLLLQFWDSDTHQALLEIIDAKSGSEISSYDAGTLGASIACYQAERESFIFLGTGEGGKLNIQTAQPK
jgi:hypothetical protein